MTINGLCCQRCSFDRYHNSLSRWHNASINRKIHLKSYLKKALRKIGWYYYLRYSTLFSLYQSLFKPAAVQSCQTGHRAGYHQNPHCQLFVTKSIVAQARSRPIQGFHPMILAQTFLAHDRKSHKSRNSTHNHCGSSNSGERRLTKLRR